MAEAGFEPLDAATIPSDLDVELLERG
jgi:hypothetical protein